MIQKQARSSASRLTTSLLVGLIGLIPIGCTNSATSNSPQPATSAISTATATTPATEKSASMAIRETSVASSKTATHPTTSNAVPVNPEPEKAEPPIALASAVATAPERQQTQPKTIDYPEISEGMSYGAFRRSAAEQGWKPNRSSSCTANVEAGSALCEQLPELQSCDKNFCQVLFNRVRTGKLITLKVFGGNNDQNALGRDSKWRVISWSIDADNSQP
jgi:hypothetical protein